MEHSEYTANIHLQTTYRGRQISTTRMPTYPPMVRFQFWVALACACALRIVL